MPTIEGMSGTDFDEDQSMLMANRVMAWSLVAASLLGAAAAPAQTTSIEALEPGRWLELPGTKIRDVLPDPLPPGYPEAIVTAWNGGMADTLRDRLIVWGGGHSDYYGNELYALDLRAGTMQRLTDPSDIGSTGRCSYILPDGNPASRHTYDNLVYMSHADRMFSFTGAYACPNGEAARDTWIFDFESLRWTELNPTGNVPVAPVGLVASAYDPVTRNVYLHDTRAFYSYSYESNRFTRLIDSADTDYHLTAAIDPVRRKFVLLGDGVQIIDLDTYSFRTVSTRNAPSFVNGRSYPGVAYDPVADRIVAWHGGNNVYALNMDTLEWTQVATGPGPNVSAPRNGTNGRWSYFPSLGVFALVNSIDQNGFVFRMTDGTVKKPNPPEDLSATTQ